MMLQSLHEMIIPDAEQGAWRKDSNLIEKTDAEQSLCALLQAMMLHFGDSVAVLDGERKLTYKQLDHQSALLANQLSAHSVAAESVIALAMDRSLEMVIAICAAIRLGASYQALSPEYSASRIEFMLKDAGASLVLTDNSLSPSALDNQQVPVFKVSQLLRSGQDDTRGIVDSLPPVTANNRLYITYTSGTTGKPKGVPITQGNMLSYVRAMSKRHQFLPGYRYALVSPLATDIGNTALFIGLLTGGCLCIASFEQVMDGAAFARMMADYQIDVLKMTPGHFRSLQCNTRFALPKHIMMFGGEALDGSLVEQIQKQCQNPYASASEMAIINHYGPSEATVGCFTYEVVEDCAFRAIPIGKPLPNAGYLLLDSHGDVITEQDYEGELLVFGAGVSQGYHLRDDLTCEKFVTVTDNKGIQHQGYRTGDRVKRNTSGDLVFLGRVDTQVKINGYRVELGEIEAALKATGKVQDAIVALNKSDSGDELIGFLVAASGSHRDIQHLLSQQLPGWMVPGMWVDVDTLPMMANGKIDRQQLLSQFKNNELSVRESEAATYLLVENAPVEQQVHVPDELPLDDTETQVLALWRTIQPQWTHHFSKHLGFSQLGGNSLGLIRLLTAINQYFDLAISHAEIMEHDSISAQAQLITVLKHNQNSHFIDSEFSEEGEL